jgi:hypothetical protein
MKTFLILFLIAAALTAKAQMPASPDEAKTWMIQHFQIPADAEIDKFGCGGSPVEAAWIHWSTNVNGEYHGHFRAYDFKEQAVIQQFDD